MDKWQAMRAFVQVAERGSFSAAAQALHVGQSTVSKWVAALEAELGVRLLDRTTRSLHLSEAGTAYHRRVTRILAALDDAEDEARERSDALRGHIRANLPVVFGERFLAAPLARFAAAHPAVRLSLHFSDAYVSPVEEGYDVTVRVGRAVDSSLRMHALGGGERVLVAAPSYLAQHGAPARPEALSQHACLVHQSQPGRAEWTLGVGDEKRRVHVSGPLQADHSGATLIFCRQGLGIAMLARWLVEDDLATGTLVPVLPEWQLPPAPVVALTPPGRYLSRPVRALILHLRKELQAR